ncbi:hypothetical protein J7E95_39695 [Streptomyces sp. ISL-14]|nr:hypothetical protein [Streptomyces sp. ISL-14]
MTELPPDPVRLRAILAHLDKQLADNETVGIYLRLQRDAVRDALARAERQPTSPQASPQRNALGSAELPMYAPNSAERRATGFVVERQPRAVGPEPVRVHTDDCLQPGQTHPISAQDARAALLDPNVIACAFCRPDTELGIDVG